jgi:hypothetical protein
MAAGDFVIGSRSGQEILKLQRLGGKNKAQRAGLATVSTATV